ncbi:50S ribosomal protein L10 [Spiroplasma sp. TIUS-1]|uniref:50S ribosomal protein L10 n=1 Tax=Spiroplasma sp. TIUS-1 TaxID=216963 RepID=UPI001397B2B9|nr:50S ribosomal protein L10 [Spiroplasma sp. TIUS-1]QHX35592.1 50S ribosomal protein L10 [Spiroplasma sp. TIUS-1]
MTGKRPAHAKKAQVIKEIADRIKNSAGFVVANYKTMTVAQMSALRIEAKKQNAIVKVYKGTLVERALKDLKIKGLDEFLVEQNVYIFSEENIAAAKLVANFKKKYKKLELVAGIVDGEVKDTVGIKEVAALPSKEELYSMFASSLLYPLRKTMAAIEAVANTKTE